MVCVSSSLSFYYALLARNTVFLLLNFFGVQAFCLSSQQQVNVVGKVSMECGSFYGFLTSFSWRDPSVLSRRCPT